MLKTSSVLFVGAALLTIALLPEGTPRAALAAACSFGLGVFVAGGRLRRPVSDSQHVQDERRRAIGRATGALAHDLAQPLTVVGGSVSLLEIESLDPEQRRQCLEAIEDQLARLERMRQEMSDFARQENGLDRTEVPIDGLLDQVASGLRSELARRDIELEVYHGYVGTASIDAERLGRVVDSLVRNAAATLQDGGRIRIQSWASQGRLGIEVEDDGPEVPEADLARVFEPFVKQRRRDGTGLGMALIADVVARHGGSVSARSNVDGTCFTIQLPCNGVEAAWDPNPPAGPGPRGTTTAGMTA